MILILAAAGAAALALAVIAPYAWSSSGIALDPARAVHAQEKAHCRSGRARQNEATCLQEAGAAYNDTRRGLLSTESLAMRTRHAQQRCNARPVDDRAACVDRVLNPQ